ncbi:unnamed protein product [Schistocephalus solidus]|uniref:Proline--tRNA ligase n=1 Tax=Schistocephalus solidus TaxID=70667 RepID=A0A183SJV1_SCHSO|nr:unnamed protein product [Schistocephalus solidus]
MSFLVFIFMQLFMHNGILVTSSPGIFVMSPLALRAVEKLSSFISHKMAVIGGQKCLFPTLGLADLWSRSGAPLILVIILSLQISAKYRDELRPRLGLLRGKEFLMKVPASGGLMGDCPSDEFQVPLPEGEDSLLWCPRCLKGKPVDSSFEHSKQPLTVCQCGSTMQRLNSVEVGHCFLLGTSYTSCFDVSIATPQETSSRPLHMGCYGIGITRLLGTAVEYFTRKANENWPDELRWPRGFAPFSGAIALQKANAKDAVSGENLAFLLSCLSDYPSCDPTATTYHAGLLPQGDILLDDRDKLSIGRKLLDLRRLGIPWVVVAKVSCCPTSRSTSILCL